MVTPAAHAPAARGTGLIRQTAPAIRTEVLLVLLVAGPVLAFSLLISAQVTEPVAIRTWSSPHEDIYFDADARRVYANMTERYSNHPRTRVHPAVSIAGYSAARLLSLTGLSPMSSVRAIVAICGFLWIAAFHLVLRLAGLEPRDAVLFSALLGASAASVFWLPIPETFLPGSITILVAIALFAAAERGRSVPGWPYLASVLSGAITISNLMAGAIVSVMGRPFRRAVAIVAAALVTLIAIWAVQLPIFPDQRFPTRRELRFLRPATLQSSAEFARTFFVHAIVMPEPHPLRDTTSPAIRLSVTHSPIGSGSGVGRAGVVLWLGLLAAGLLSLPGAMRRSRIWIAIAATAGAQFTLHLVYGHETFLYSPHYVPLLIALAAAALLTPAATIVRVAGWALVALLLFNNLTQLRSVLHYVNAMV